MKLSDILKACNENRNYGSICKNWDSENGGECMDDIAYSVFPKGMRLDGTSYATPIRTAKLALNDI